MFKKYFFILLLFNVLCYSNNRYQLSKLQQGGIAGLIIFSVCSWFIYKNFFHRHREIYALDLTKIEKHVLCNLYDILAKFNEDNIKLYTSKINGHLFNSKFIRCDKKNTHYEKAFEIIKGRFDKYLSKECIKTMICYTVQDGPIGWYNLIDFIFQCHGESFFLDLDAQNNNIFHLICNGYIDRNRKNSFKKIFKHINNKEIFDHENGQGETPLFLIINSILTKDSSGFFAQLLVKNGCNLFKKNTQQNKTPFGLIFESKNKERQVDALWTVLIIPKKGDKDFSMLSYSEARKEEYEEYVKNKFDKLGSDTKRNLIEYYDKIKNLYKNFSRLYNAYKNLRNTHQTPFDDSTYPFIKIRLLLHGFNHITQQLKDQNSVGGQEFS